MHVAGFRQAIPAQNITLKLQLQFHHFQMVFVCRDAYEMGDGTEEKAW
jgi:hypothetical protein